MMKNDVVICKDNGIYGIYIIDDVNQTEELIYIGKTRVSFEERFRKHLSNYNNLVNKDKKFSGKQAKLYYRISQARRSGLTVELKPLVQLDEVVWEQEYIDAMTLSGMEIALIHLYKPICNVEGVSAPIHIDMNDGHWYPRRRSKV